MSKKTAPKPAPKKRNALGRGLESLLDDASHVVNNQPSSAGASSEIDIISIETNPFQPRKHFDSEALDELATSIKVHGIIQPITVRKVGKDKYQLISGERRLQASKRAGIKALPAYVRAANDQQMIEMGLIENIQREDLNAIEVALSYQRLISECNLKHEEVGDRVGKKRATINNYLRLLKLPPDIQIALRDNKISMGHARAIINIENIDDQLDVYKKILSEDLSVRKVEALVRQLVLGGQRNRDKAPQSADSIELKKINNKLTSYFGTKVQIKSSKEGKGTITIPFLSSDDFNRILEIIEG